jgi:hypothetical protein
VQQLPPSPSPPGLLPGKKLSIGKVGIHPPPRTGFGHPTWMAEAFFLDPMEPPRILNEKVWASALSFAPATAPAEMAAMMPLVTSSAVMAAAIVPQPAPSSRYG